MVARGAERFIYPHNEERMKKFLRLWNKTREMRMRRMPFPIYIALQIMKERHKLSALEDAVFLIIKRDPEAREIIQYVLEGKTKLRFKDDPTVEEEIASED